jgi:hypothetical protein
MRHLITTLSVIFLIAGCASTHDLNSGPNPFGGGVRHEELKPGLYSVTAITNWAPWPNYSGAKSAWTKVADSVCGAGAYKELGVSAEARNTGLPPMGVLTYIITVQNGYVLCSNAKTTLDEAMGFLKINTTLAK